MNSSIMTAKNTFGEGLIMDFSPDNTQSSVLTSALNATLLTFNGNEMTLQNDMGNGRVETARLPEGYVPVGTCEFGDIIYIISYNPLIDKAQIGCFPSPERLISSEEISNLGVMLSSEDFQELKPSKLKPSILEPSGRLKNSSCKKILYEKNLNPGDKYIIYETTNALTTCKNTITDIDNTSRIFGKFPKFVKIHIVAIEDSGKINFLDSSVKWYGPENSNSANNNLTYFIQSVKSDLDSPNHAPDIDSYRSLISSAYSTFQSKVSGKLALFIELERIKSFSCTYEIFSKNHTTNDIPELYLDSNDNILTQKTDDCKTFLAKDYNVYWNVSWDTDDVNINPSYVVLTKSNWSGKNDNLKGIWFDYKKQNDKYLSDENDIKYQHNINNINQNKVDSFYDNSENLNSDYWFNEIKLSYTPGTASNFKNFVEKESYQAKEKEFLDSQIFDDIWIYDKENKQIVADGVSQTTSYVIFNSFTPIEKQNTLSIQYKAINLNSDNYFTLDILKKEEIIYSEIVKNNVNSFTTKEIPLTLNPNEEYQLRISYNNKKLKDLQLYINNIKINSTSKVFSEDFTTNNNFQFINNQTDANPTLNLMKLNVSREESGEPKMDYKYHINAQLLKDGKYYTSENGQYKEIQAVEINDDIVNNYFKYGVYKKFNTFIIPTHQKLEDKILSLNISNLIYHYNITPAMQYGLLEDLTQEGYIDFNRIGSGDVNVNQWRYYVTENIINFSLGLEVYPETNKGVAEVVLEFYDNQGVAAAYHIANKSSYSGIFSEFIPLNNATQSYKLNNIDASNKEFIHAGLKATEQVVNPVGLINSKPIKLIKKGEEYFYKQDNNDVKYSGELYVNDAGILYSNLLYYVKITVKYCSKNVLGEYNIDNTQDFKVFKKWMWTNTIFNNHYYDTPNFDDLPFNLILDCVVNYTSSDTYNYKNVNYKTPNIAYNADEEKYKYLNANVQYISGNNNIKYFMNCGLTNAYNTFRVKYTEDISNNIKLRTYLGKQYVENTQKEFEIGHLKESDYNIFDELLPINNDEKIFPKYSAELEALLKRSNIPNTEALKAINSEDYKKYTNQFNLSFSKSNSEKLDYINYQGNEVLNYDCDYEDINLNSILSFNKESEGGNLSLALINFSKYCNINKYSKENIAVLNPIIRTKNDLESYGFDIKNNHAVLKYLYSFWMKNDGNGTHNHFQSYKFQVLDNTDFQKNGDSFKESWEHYDDLSQFGNSLNQSWWSKQPENYKKYINKGFSLFGFAWGDGHSKIWLTHDNSKTNYNQRLEPLNKRNPQFLQTFNLNGNVSSETFNYELQSNKSYIDWDNPMYGIGFYSDNSDNYHFLNTFYIPTIKNNVVTQEMNFKTSINNVSTYVGDALLSILSQIYVYTGEQINKQVISNIDTLYLKNNPTLYTKDIIYKLTVNSEDHNSLILMSDLDYSNYIKKLKEFAGEDINTTNVDLILQGCIKNLPIQFKIDSITPSILDFISEYNIQINKIGENPINTSFSGLKENALYQLNDNTILPINNKFQYKYIKSISLDKDLTNIIPEYYSEYVENPYIHKLFTFNDLLKLKIDNKPLSSECFSVSSKDYKDNAYMVLKDIVKDEVILPFGKLIV